MQQRASHPRCGTIHIGFIFGSRGNRWYGDERFKVIQKLILVFTCIFNSLLNGGHKPSLLGRIRTGSSNQLDTWLTRSWILLLISFSVSGANLHSFGFFQLPGNGWLWSLFQCAPCNEIPFRNERQSITDVV